MAGFPPLDLHAHIEPTIPAREIDALEAIVFAVTRSLDEAATAVARTDDNAIWGVGCHPGLAKSHANFSGERFAELLQSTCFAGELGLDGVKGKLDRQVGTLRTAFGVLAGQPRITSLHSAGATSELIDELERTPIVGSVLHWWLGSPAETVRAVELGCYFSLNIAGVHRNDLLSLIPLERLLTETDHPFGDRRSKPHRPGNVGPVEERIGCHHGLSPDAVRRQIWKNLATVVQEARCGRLVPRAIRRYLAALPTNS